MDSSALQRRQSRKKRLSPSHQRSSDGASSSAQIDTEPAAHIPGLPIPTGTSLSKPDGVVAAPEALVTQVPRAELVERAATVVTITQTQTNDNANAGGSDNAAAPASTIPIGIIVASVVVGVVLAVVVVGVWVWWGKRLKRRSPYKGATRPSHRNQQSQSSTARLAAKAGSANSSPNTSPRQEKAQPHYPQTAPPHGSSRSNQSKRPHAAGGVAAAAGIPGAGSSNPSPVVVTTPASKRRSPPGLSPSSSSEAPSSPASTVVGEESPRAGLTVAKTYTPQKSSPLAQGAERIKPKEKPKINEWGTPISPTKTSSAGHGGYFGGGSSSNGHDEKAGAGSQSQSQSQSLAVPGPTVAESDDPNKNRISVLSADSYYGPESTEDEGHYVGVALGGDDVSHQGQEGYPPRPPVYGEDQHYYQQQQQQQYNQQQGWR